MTLGREPCPAPVRGARAAVAGAAIALLAGCAASPDAVPAADAVLELLDVAWSAPTSDVARMEQLVAECMADAGFTYVPTTGASSAGAPDSPSGQTDGYGITSSAWPGPPDADPNAAAVAALAPTEQQAYWTTLEGATVQVAEEAGGDGAWQYDWQRAGCRGRAQHQVYGDPAQLDDAAALQAELAEARLAAAADARVAELDVAWAACMATAGHPGLTTADAAEASVREAWDALWAQTWADLPADPSASDVATAEAAATTAVAELADLEVTMAAADRACRDQVGYDVARAAVTAEYQQRFYQAHRTALEAWLAPAVAVDG